MIRSGNGGGLRFGAQHSQSVENWAMMIPGLKVVVPCDALDVIGLMAASIRDDDPVIFLEAKSLYASKMEVPDGEIVDDSARRRSCASGPTPPSWRSAPWSRGPFAAAERVGRVGIERTVVDVRTLVPSTPRRSLREVSATGRLFTVEENPGCAAGAASSPSIVAEELFYDLDGPIVRITTPHIPLPAADASRTWPFPRSSASSPPSTKSMNS